MILAKKKENKWENPIVIWPRIPIPKLLVECIRQKRQMSLLSSFRRSKSFEAFVSSYHLSCISIVNHLTLILNLTKVLSFDANILFIGLLYRLLFSVYLDVDYLQNIDLHFERFYTYQINQHTFHVIQTI